MDVKSADKRPEKYVGPDGKPRIRMVPADNQVIKKESAVDEVSLSAIKKAVQGSGLSNVKKAMPTDKLKKDLAKMKLKLATEGTLSEATDMNKLKQLAAAGLVQKTDVQKLLRVFAKMESGKTVTPAEREMLLSVLSDLTALITGDMSMLQKAKKAVKEDVELNEGIEKMSHSRLKWHMNTGTPHGSYSKDEMKAERDRRLMHKDSADAYKKAKASMSEETELDEGLGHISAIQNMMAKEREAQAAKKKKYTAPTQAEIDADKKKDRAAQRAAGEKRPSASLKSIRQKQYGKMMGGLKKEEAELDEGILKPYHAIGKQPWSKTVKDSKGTAGEYKQIAKGKDFTVWYAYRGSNKSYPHYVVKDDKIIGSGMTVKSALKDAGLKDKDLTSRSKFADGSPLNKGMKESVELEEKAPKMQGDFLKKERERNRAHDAAMGRTPTGRKKPVRQMTSTQKSLAAFRKEEKVDEVLDTPKAMDSYRNKAKYSRDRAANSAAAKMLRDPKGFHSTDTSDELKTMDKRAKGLKMADKAAAKKTRAMLMKKEEVQLDELSPNTLHSYIKGASKDLAKRSRMSGYDDKRGNYADGDKNRKRANKRMAGIASASGRMADKANMAEEYVNEKLKVSHGMGAWIDDFKKSDAPQFKGKSDKERRDMAIAAFLSAKRGGK